MRVSLDRLPVMAGVRPQALAPILVVIALFKLAISDGGRDLTSLSLAQGIIMLVLGVIVWTGAAHRTPVTRTLAAMVAAVAVTSLWSVRPEASVRQALLWIMYLGISVITATTLNGVTATRRFLDALVVIAGWLCLIALFMFWGADDPGMRWYSTFYWPNPFAAFLLLVYPLAVVRLAHSDTGRDALAHGAVALLLGAAILLTYSRGAWLALLLVTPLGMVVLRPRRWPAAGLRLAVLAALTVGISIVLTQGVALRASPEGVVGRAASVTDTSDYAIRGRLHFWRAGLAIFADHPVVGTGPGTFGAVHAVYQRDVRYYARDAHSLYVQTAAEMGLVGLAALGLLLAATTGTWVRSLKAVRDRAEYPLIAGAGLGLAAFMIHSAVEMVWMFPAAPAMAFAMIGVLVYYDRAHAPTPTSATVPQGTLRRLAVVGLGAVVGVVGAMHFGQREFIAAQEQARAGRWAAAAERYHRAVRWNPLSAGYLAALAATLVRTAPARPDAAAAALRKAMALDRMNAGIPLQLARLLLEAPGQGPPALAEAESLLRRSLALDPWNWPVTYRTLAQLYLRQGRIADADRVYHDALPRYVGRKLGARSALYLILWPEVVGLFLDAAEASAQHGDRVRAAQILEMLLAEDPDVVPAVLRLSEIYAAADRRDDARRLLEAAVARMPDNGAIAAALTALR